MNTVDADLPRRVMAQVGCALRHVRVLRGVSLQALGKATPSRITQSQLSAIERGQGTVTVARLVEISLTLGTTPLHILDLALAEHLPNAEGGVTVDVGLLADYTVIAALRRWAKTRVGNSRGSVVVITSEALIEMAALCNMKVESILWELRRFPPSYAQSPE